MKKKLLFKTMDILIIGVIVIQFVIFLLNYETALVVTLFAAIQFFALLLYFIYALRLRNSFEEIIIQENLFFTKQFDEIRETYDQVTYRISDFLDRQKAIENIRRNFTQSRFFYRKHLITQNNNKVFFDLLLITNAGLYIINFFDSRLIVNGNYQDSHISLQYSKNNQVDVINPLSPVFPFYQELKTLLEINNDSLIKRLLIINDGSYATNLESLDNNQSISKDFDVLVKVNELMNKNKVELSLEEIKRYELLIDKKITG